MKTHFVTLCMRIGEYEKLSSHLIKASDSDQAQEYAVFLESHDPGRLEWDSNGAADLGWEFFYNYYEAKEVPEDHVAMMEKYLPLNTCDPSELTNAGNYKKLKGID